MIKIGDVKALQRFGMVIASFALALAAPAPTRAADGDPVEFSAQVDRTSISLDDSVSLKLTLRTEGVRGGASPQFEAPDFITVNEFSGTFIESFYENGRFGVRNNFSVTKILKPQKTGALKISQIRVNVGGKEYRSADIIVDVAAGGVATPPPVGYGGSGVGLRGSGKTPRGAQVFVRAEVSKDRAVRGEQVVVSYYLYRRTKVFNIQVEKYPALGGFLREDLEMPVLGARLETESVMLDGVRYDRSLLVRYAAYPLQVGTLKVDSMAVKFSYYNQPRANRDSRDFEDDPFFNFFQQMTPLVGNHKSDVVSIRVDELPGEGRPASFGGGVGQFSIVAAADKTELKAGEAVTLTVKVEGRGNVSALAEPKASWPAGVEVYDSKGRAKTTARGIGEKIFEIILIPRQAGNVVLPPLEFSYFDPVTRRYVSKSTEPMSLSVLPGSAATQTQGAATPTEKNTNSPSVPLVQRPLKPESASISARPGVVTLGRHPVWRWLYWAFFGSLLVFVLYVIGDRLKKRKPADAMGSADGSHTWVGIDRERSRLLSNAQESTPGEWISLLVQVEDLLLESLERAYPNLPVRAIPREELGARLREGPQWNEALASRWVELERILSEIDALRFSGSNTRVARETLQEQVDRLIDRARLLSSW